MSNSIEIKGTKYPVKFGYGAFRILGEMWGEKGVQSVSKKFQDIFNGSGEEISFEQTDMLGDLVIAGVENAQPEITLPFDRDDAAQEVLFSEDKLTAIMHAFTESFPKSGNPKPRKPARASKAKK